MIEIRLKNDGGGFLIDGPAVVPACLSSLPPALGGLDGGESLIPEHDFFACFLPQGVGELLKLFLGVGVGAVGSGEADHETVDVEGSGDPLDGLDGGLDRGAAGNRRMRRGQDPGVAVGKSDTPCAVVDSHPGHGRYYGKGPGVALKPGAG